MASSSRGRRKVRVVDMEDVPAPLRARLGIEATTGLLELLTHSHDEAREAVVLASAERFERRLVEEIAGVRVQIAQVESGLRQEMAQLGATFRAETGEIRAGLREDMAAVRVDLFKWSFIFWIGQVVAITGIVGVMLQLSR